MDPRDKALMALSVIFTKDTPIPQKKWYETWKFPKYLFASNKSGQVDIQLYKAWDPWMWKIPIPAQKKTLRFPMVLEGGNCQPPCWEGVGCYGFLGVWLKLKLPEWWHPTPGTALRRRWRPTSQPAAWVICVGLWMVMTFGQSVWCHEVAAWVLRIPTNWEGMPQDYRLVATSATTDWIIQGADVKTTHATKTQQYRNEDVENKNKEFLSSRASVSLWATKTKRLCNVLGSWGGQKFYQLHVLTSRKTATSCDPCIFPSVELILGSAPTQ